ncbi:MAG: peroxiredoxin family protein [Limisphaerales bacterium]
MNSVLSPQRIPARILAVILLLFGTIGVTEAQDQKIVRSPEFSLMDQYETRHDLKFPRDKVTVLVVADQKGSKQLEGWIQPIYRRYQKKIDISGVADLGNVPKRLQNFVRSSFRKQSDYPILLDWTGEVSASFKYASSKANLYLIDQQGNILLHFIGPATRELQDILFKEIDGRLTGSE